MPTAVQTTELLATDQSEVWLTDGGASRHLTYRREWLTEYRPITKGSTVALGDDEECEIVGEGTAIVTKLADAKWDEIRIENVLYVPKLKKNLFSVGVCDSKGFQVTFKNGFVELVRDNELVASGVKQKNGIYRMFFKTRIQNSTEQANAAAVSLRVWHERLGHVYKRAIHKMIKKGLVTGVSMKNIEDFFEVKLL